MSDSSPSVPCAAWVTRPCKRPMPQPRCGCWKPCPNISLLFTDIVMPGEMDGVRLAAEAQRRYPGLRVLLTSGYTEHALIGNGQPTDGVEVLTKPYRKRRTGQETAPAAGPARETLRERFVNVPLHGGA